MRRVLVVAVLAAITAPGSAHAGRTFYGWLFGSEVMPERGVELQSWITEANLSTGDMEVHETNWLFGAQVGITDQLELGLPLEFAWISVEPGSPRTVFDRYGIEARYRFVTQDPEDAPEFAPLVRVGVKRLVTNRDAIRPEINLVASYESGIVHVLADIGFIAEINVSPEPMEKNTFELRPGIGVSVLAIEDADLRFGAELYSEIKLGEEGTWLMLGPNLSWTHGRFWVSAAYGFGLITSTKTNAPRVQWGIAF